MIDGNKLGEVGFEYIGTPYSVMDCQAFVEQCISDCGVHKNLAGSNAWYRFVMENGWVGTPEECVALCGKVPKGAFLFILKNDGKEPEHYKKDGLGNASHIGLCTGTSGEGAIHSSSSKGCVCESEFKGKTIKNGGWNRVGLWDGVEYNAKLPERETLTVYAQNGKPVNLRKKPSKLSAKIASVPCGEKVELIERLEDWCKVKYCNLTGYMMTEFLLSGDIPVTYSVTIHGLSYEDAETIALDYENAEIKEERG